MVLLEQPLKTAAFCRLCYRHNLNLLQERLIGVWRRVGRGLFRLHAADFRKSEGQCPAQSAFAPLFRPPATFMHTRCAIVFAGTVPFAHRGCLNDHVLIKVASHPVPYYGEHTTSLPIKYILFGKLQGIVFYVGVKIQKTSCKFKSSLFYLSFIRFYPRIP